MNVGSKSRMPDEWTREAQAQKWGPVTPLSTLVQDYLFACRARGLSPKTIQWSYGYPLISVLLPFCEREGITEVAELTNKTLNRLSNELQTTGGKRGPLAPASIHTYMRAINHLLAWAGADGETVTGHAQLPRLPKKLVDVLNRDEIQAMENAAQSERDKLIIRLLADTGIRVGELVALRRKDLFESNRNHYIKVLGKGSKDRLVPVPRLYRRLERYAEGVRAYGNANESARMFRSLRRDRRSGAYEPLTTSGVAQLLQTAAWAAGIQKRVYPHLFRHSFGTWQLTRGTNPIQLANIMGHSSLAMITNVYAHLSPQDAYEAMLKSLTEAD